ncbi:sporulation protein YjcZ [Paenibacillus sp. UNC451MF]|nr:sporulation protein YjcZ [Paenibacillus sp. UNC451MF]
MGGLVGGAGCGIGGAFTSIGVILVLFILLVIVTRGCLY